MATLDGKLNMSLPANFVYFYIDNQGDKFNENDKYRLSVAGIKPATVTGWDETFSKKELGAGKPMWGFKYGDGIAFAGIKDDTWETTGRHQLILFSDGDPALTKTIKTKLESHASVKLANPLDPANSWTQAIAAPTYTEMGAGGLKWGDWNLGATSLNDYGTSFRWGEIVTYDGTRDSRYSAHNLTGNYAIFDAARAYLGADWRMPTRTEIDALRDGSTNSEASSGNVTAGTISRQGVKSVSNTAPDNSLFFPKPDDNSSGGYWSSTAYSGSAYYYWVGSSKLMSSSGGAIATPYAIRPIYIGE
jgi:hypothetical protein